jgi:signal transduction histidine kinase
VRVPFHLMHERSHRLTPRVVDGGVVVAVAAIGLFGLIGPVALFDASPQRVTVAGVTLVFMNAAPLWWRRSEPVVVLAVVLAAFLVAQSIGDPNVPSFVGVHAASYSVGAYAARRRALAGLGMLGVTAAADAAVVWVAQTGGSSTIALGPFGLITVGAWVLGRYIAVRRAYLDTLVAYGQQLEKDRDAQARRAVREERRRIARDLHDQVAHHVGVVSLQTSAARRWLDRDRTRTASALAAAENAARAALETMPAILHALRADETPADREPQPTLDAIGDLISQVTSDDVTIDLRVNGAPRTLPPAVELTAYRLVQEALTNVVKHAGHARAVVDLDYRDDCLDVEVADDGHGAAATPSGGAQLGLVGMRERVEMLNGTFAAGPRAGGGFSVRARLPVRGGVG